MAIKARGTGPQGFLLALALIIVAQATATPTPADAQSRSWEAVAEASTPTEDSFIVELLTNLPLTDALAVARALPRRENPDIAEPLRALHRGPGAHTQRAELLSRVAINALNALPVERRGPALEANAELIRHFLGESARFDSPMLRAAVWQAAAASGEQARRAMLPAARTSAAALHERFVAAVENRGGEAGRQSERVRNLQLSSEALAFFSYASATADAT
ncbi:MAG: hypothetical protein GVY23_00815, partial [Spirochaetes bacterium]|nr:hypothetical protein [Spirochaetota bacterium]